MTLLVVVGVSGLSGCGGGAPDPAAEAVAKANAAAEEAAKAKARAEAEAARETERLANLWTYSDVPVEKGRQLAASIRSTNDVDTGGDGPRSVMLVFRDHAAWGRSSYLVLTAGDFRCAPTCTVSVKADAAAPKSMAAHRPNTNDAIALFIDDARGLWRTAGGAKQLAIEFPVKAGGTRSATFDVAGLNQSKMPRWGVR